jgi:protein arginine kinase activator
VSLCDNCGEREAVVHLTQIVDNTITTLSLCEPCAAEKGVETGSQAAKFPLGDFLASLGEVPGAAGGVAEADAACPSCGGTLRDFRQTGRLGCAGCYQAFEGQLRDLLRRIHGNSQHAGERYRGAGTGDAPAAEEGRAGPGDSLADLRERLRRAVDAEDFELAARLRDVIRGLE